MEHPKRVLMAHIRENGATIKMPNPIGIIMPNKTGYAFIILFNLFSVVSFIIKWRAYQDSNLEQEFRRLL